MLTEIYRLFPRQIAKGQISDELLKTLHRKADKAFTKKQPDDASSRLAGRLEKQVWFPLTDPIAKDLSGIFAHSCWQWIQEAKTQWDNNTKAIWSKPFGVNVYEIWFNKQIPGDFNPVHIHGGDFSGVLYLDIPESIDDGDGVKGMLGIHGPECYNPRVFQMGMIQYFKPKAGEYWVFPAWQPHSVMPFDGPGERWSMAFNAEIVLEGNL
tara:strand:+ start:4270 stop:4899 length:630 start_codon:yes stop_codon:yes gene_type:complete